MKTIYFLLLSILILDSCKKSFLDLQPHSTADISALYKTASDFRVAVNGAYTSLQKEGEYRTAMWQVGEVRSDNSFDTTIGGNFPGVEIDQFSNTSSNSILDSMWQNTYHGILLCNIILDRIAPIEMSVSLKKQYTGEMQFLRALMYFNLVRTFGDVPLVIKETVSIEEGYQQGRAKTEDVYRQIIADLKSAADSLPVSYDNMNIGRATSGAAKSLLGKVYLTRHNYDSCASILKEVINAAIYRLSNNYSDLWKPANSNGPESIFEVQYKKGGQGTGSPYANFFAPVGSGLAVTVVGTAYGRNTPTQDLIAAYEPGDQRKSASVALGYQLNGQTINTPYTTKYRDVPYVEGDANDNWTVLRYADVMLMYAEALNEINNGPVTEAYQMIDAVRARAGLAPLSAALDKTNFAVALEHERRVELAFEGHRWFDLLRTGRAIEVMNNFFKEKIIVQPYQLLFPVPQSQINIDPALIKQNEGY